MDWKKIYIQRATGAKDEQDEDVSEKKEHETTDESFVMKEENRPKLPEEAQETITRLAKTAFDKRHKKLPKNAGGMMAVKLVCSRYFVCTLELRMRF